MFILHIQFDNGVAQTRKQCERECMITNYYGVDENNTEMTYMELKSENIKGKRAAFLSLGCKVNAYETECMRQLFEEAGATTVDFQEKADIYVINTCTVTSIADRKSRQMLHRAKKQNPDSVVVAVGCYVETDREKLLNDLAVDVLIGNHQKQMVVDVVTEYLMTGKEDGKAFEKRINQKEYDEIASLQTIAEKTRAYIKIQDGCNQFCTYCIIPFARGRIRSRGEGEIVREVKGLVAKGYKEIVLTGIHLSSYGLEVYPEAIRFALEIPGEKMPLLSLIEKLSAIEGLERIRLGSLEPRIVTEEFVADMAKTKVCPHFHLSLQSGCDATLERMNRRYDTERYRESCRILRKYYVHPAITTDVIVGFPGETEEEFETTKEFLKEIRFAQMHIFKYSKREGTKAAVMPNQVPDEIKAIRSDVLLDAERQMRQDYEQYFVGCETTVLWEEELMVDGERYMTGHNERYVRFAMRTEADLSNQMMCGKVSSESVGESMVILAGI